MIEVKDLTKSYGNFVAVKGINFRAESGQILGFLGPNGAGKTTTMRIITGFMPATSGTVVIDGLAFAPILAVSVPQSGTAQINFLMVI